MWQIFLPLGLFYFITLSVCGVTAQCPEKFTLIEDKCYKVVENYLSTWHDAKNKCQQLGAKLVNIENEAQMVALAEHLAPLGAVVEDDVFWTGDIKIETSSKYWTPVEINGSGNGFDSDDDDDDHDVDMLNSCTHIKYGSDQFYANKENCAEESKFICEAPVEYEKNDAKLNPNKCPEQFKLIGEKCYYFEKNKEMTLDDARNKCVKLNAKLMNIKSEEELNWFKTEILLNPKALEELNIFGYDYNMFGPQIFFIYIDDSEKCLYISHLDTEYFMMVEKCYDADSFICETNPVIETETKADESSAANCLEGFTKVGDKCYFVDNKNLLNWHEADIECRTRSAKLIQIENDEQMKALSDHLLHLDCKDCAFWIGANGLGIVLRNAADEYMMEIEKGYSANYYICETNSRKKDDLEAEIGIGNTRSENTGNKNIGNEVQACPKDFQQIGKKCYRFEVEESTWFDANERCEAMNSKIARIENSIEMANLNKYLLNKNINEDLWISGDDIINEGTFVWGAQHEVVTYTHFWDDDDERFQNSEMNCLGLTKEHGEFYMEAFVCREEKPIICEVKAKDSLNEIEVEESTLTTTEVEDEESKTTTELIPEDSTTAINVEPTETVANDACPKSFVQHGEKCYYFAMEKQNWFNAHHSCSELNAELVTIENANEMRILSKYLIDNSIDDGFWTTGNDLGSENNFRWNSNGKTMTYTKWQKDEPNNYENEDCVQIRIDDDEYFMNDLDCSIKNRFICETKIISKLPTSLASRVALETAEHNNECEYLNLLQIKLDSELKIAKLMHKSKQCSKIDL